MVEVKIDMVQEGSFGNLKNWYGAERICQLRNVLKNDLRAQKVYSADASYTFKNFCILCYGRNCEN